MLKLVTALVLALVLASIATAGFCAPNGTSGDESRGPVFSGPASDEVSDFDRLDEVFGRPNPSAAAGADTTEAKAAVVNNFGNGEVGYMRRTDSPATGYAVSMPAGSIQYTNVR